MAKRQRKKIDLYARKKLWCIFTLKGRKKQLQRCTTRLREALAIRNEAAKRHPQSGRWVVKRPTRAEAKQFGILHKF